MNLPAVDALLLVVRSPLQAFNAVEFVHSLPRPPAHLRAFVVTRPNEAALEAAIRAVLRHLPTCALHPLPGLGRDGVLTGPLGEFRRARRFRRAWQKGLAGFPARPALALGDYRNRECRHLAAGIEPASVFLLDDGSATHQIARHRLNPRDPALAPLFPGQDTRALRCFLWAGLRLTPPAAVTFFTIYQPPVSSPDHVVLHRYQHWREQLARLPPRPSSPPLFLGMSHVEKKLVPFDRYLDLITRIRRHYGLRPVIYRPHRDESADKLAHVAALGFSVAPLDPTPIEIALLHASSLPEEVASAASSALDNLPHLFGASLPVRCFLPDPDYCQNAYRPHLDAILNHHRQHPSGLLQLTSLPPAKD